MTSFGGGYRMESAESSALRSINTDSYDYRDQAKLLTKLTGDVSYMAQYMRQMQKGIDAANENFIQQINDFIQEIVVVLGGGGNTGFDFGDLKYLFQAVGKLFGFDQGGTFPINLFSAAWHFFSTYIVPVGSFDDIINNFIDSSIATMLDLFGEIPIIGGAVQQFGVWISDFRDALVNGGIFLNGLLSDWTSALVGAIKNTIEAVQNIVDWFTGGIKSAISNLFNWGKRLPIMNLTTNTVESSNIPELDASKVTSGTLGTARIADGAISRAKIASTAIDSTKIDIGAVGTTHISDSAISNAKLGTDISGDKIVVGTVGSGRIAALDASKITTGSFGSGFITDGAISNTKLGTDISGSKIAVGTVSAARIDVLDASKITSGTFGNTRISDGAISTLKIADLAVTGVKTAGLDASKITSGTVAAANVGSLPASQITSGSFGTNFISDGAISTIKIADLAVTGAKTTGLDASKVTSGTLGTGVIPNITKSMSTDLQSTINNIYTGWNGVTGTGAVAEVQTTIESIKSKIIGGWTVTPLTSSGTWNRPWTPGTVDEPREFWAICIGSGKGGDSGVWQQTSVTPSLSGGPGGTAGNYIAQQINVADIPASVNYTIGLGGAGGQRSSTSNVRGAGGAEVASSFGSLADSSSATSATIGSLFGYYDGTTSSPGVGGSGGVGSAGGSSTGGSAGTSTPLASGGSGGALQTAGGAGGTASLTGQTRAGGGGGGGGGGTSAIFQTAGNGGVGGFPGGGGGGGGSGASNSLGHATPGNGGAGGNGVIVLLYR